MCDERKREREREKERKIDRLYGWVEKKKDKEDIRLVCVQCVPCPNVFSDSLNIMNGLRYFTVLPLEQILSCHRQCQEKRTFIC